METTGSSYILEKSKNDREVELSDIILELEKYESIADRQGLEIAKKELEAIDQIN